MLFSFCVMAAFRQVNSLVDFNEPNGEEKLPLVQAIVDHHHSEVKTATKVRFAEPGGKEGGSAPSSPPPNNSAPHQTATNPSSPTMPNGLADKSEELETPK